MRGIVLKYGLIMFAGFLVYFLLMLAIGMSGNYYFRIFNGVIHIALITLAIKRYKDLYPEEFNYLSGVSTGIITSLVGVVPFAVFILIFTATVPDFMESIRTKAEDIGQYLTPFTSALVVLLEGLGVSVLASYIIMRIVDSYR